MGEIQKWHMGLDGAMRMGDAGPHIEYVTYKAHLAHEAAVIEEINELRTKVREQDTRERTHIDDMNQMSIDHELALEALRRELTPREGGGACRRLSIDGNKEGTLASPQRTRYRQPETRAGYFHRL